MNNQDIESTQPNPTVDNDLIFLFNLRKSLLCISFISLLLSIFDLYNSIFMLIPILLIIISCCGFKYYNKWLSLGYIVYNIGKIISDLYFIFNINNNFGVILLTISILFELYLIELTSRFFIRLWYLSPIKLGILKDNYRPSRYYIVYY